LTKDFAVIPVKGLLESKSRLSPFLAPPDRKKIIVSLLKDVLAAVDESALFRRILVVSPDRNVEDVARQHHGMFLHQEGQGLNSGVRQSTGIAMQENASSVVVILADIPLLEPRDLKEMYSLGEKGSRVVLSPSLKAGTNVMIREPANTIPPAYGRWSFSTHLRAAQKIGVATYSVSNPRLSFDVDTPDDLIAVRKKDPRQLTQTARSIQELTSLHVTARGPK
jgi:2-phospho-L-lactate/phosphoenolpyruvate guanylyltransferase